MDDKGCVTIIGAACLACWALFCTFGAVVSILMANGWFMFCLWLGGAMLSIVLAAVVVVKNGSGAEYEPDEQK